MDNTHDGSIAARLRGVRASLPERVRLVAVSKFHPVEALREAYDAGQRIFGESRAQELAAKAAVLPDDIEWHFIGHLQTNKVKYVVGRVALIHSISSEKLLRAVAAQADKLGAVQDILLEINLAGEASKSGFSPQEALPAARLAAELTGVRLRGLMCIPPAASCSGGNLPYFQKLCRLAVDITREMLDNVMDMDVLSMGMSGDWPDAVAAGSTCIRVGSALFGPRPPVSNRKD